MRKSPRRDPATKQGVAGGRSTSRAALTQTTPSRRAPSLLLTCEHGGNLIPLDLAPVFAGRERLLNSHRGWDPGALELAGHLAATLQAPMRFALVSRLVVDLNRSEHNPTLFSDLTAALDDRSRRTILQRHYHPYRREVESAIGRLARPAFAPCMHLSIHTFTPIFRGKRRDIDIGLLFDPGRRFEARAAAVWERHLRRALPRMRIGRNQPYRGTDDGLTTHLRTRFADDRYAGLELEVNQRFPRRTGKNPRAWIRLQQAIASSLAAALVSLSEPITR